MATALITGGSVGLGRAFARRLARDGWDLVLASRDQDGLEQVASDLRSIHGVAVEVIRSDLSERGDSLRLAARLEDPDRPVDLLVNNAGFGIHDPLATCSVERLARAVEVMDLAPAILAAAAARAMRERGRGGIVNITSSAAVLRTGAYAAVKAWATVYSQSLAIELADSGVRVLAVMPGWIETEFHKRAGIQANAFPAALKPLVYVPADQVVDQALEALAKGKTTCVPTKRWAAAVWLARVIPESLNRKVSAALTDSRT
ncbi:MAG: SDR family NAD(P)-dependent oxidoreductase [Propionibacteriaceae bacterium]|jgi:short-subunit dehydrogenase|nr:SDR family NAD(P)-dependent oxidoreductase [Propionibacteriaceae bacterium]